MCSVAYGQNAKPTAPRHLLVKARGFSSNLDLGFIAASAHGRPLGHDVEGRANREKTAARLHGMESVFLSGN